MRKLLRWRCGDADPRPGRRMEAGRLPRGPCVNLCKYRKKRLMGISSTRGGSRPRSGRADTGRAVEAAVP